jgi:hypothetical protein
VSLVSKTKAGWAVALTVIFFIMGTLILSPTQALSGNPYYSQDTSKEENQGVPIQTKPLTNDTSKTDTTVSETSSVALAQATYDLSSTKMGIYTGPGDIKGHNSFETWLGKPIPYTTDYIDYKGGWSKDFIDSNLWLMRPWGQWVSQGGRRLVLGVPMLENNNVGQFDQGVNGDFDSYFRSLASQLVADSLGNTIIRLGYEANCNTIGPWQAVDNPAGYKLLYRHEAAIMRSVPGADFLFDWTVCNGLQSGHALNSFDSFYPGDDVVNIVGMDIYDVKWQDTSVTPQARWSYITSRQMGVNDLAAFARTHGKPLSYPEWGLYAPGDSFAGGGDNPYFIQKMAELISSTKPVYQAYFNLDWGSGVLSDFKQGQTAYKQIFGQ